MKYQYLLIANINLGLRVKYKRSDEFHKLESIFQEIDFADKLIIKKSNSITFNTNPKKLINSENNLSVKAAKI